MLRIVYNVNVHFFGGLFSSVSILTLFHTAFTFQLYFLFVTVLVFGLLITCITILCCIL